MSIVIIFAALFLLALSISELFNKQFVEGLPCAVSVIILVLYISGFLNKMYLATYSLVLLSFAAAAVVVFWRKGRLNFKRSNLGGVLVFSIVFAYFWYIGQNSLIYSYDEFSHWGLVVKNMYLYNNFGNIAPTTATFLTYPPAQGLFEYFFLKVSRSYNESLMILATNIMLVSFVLPVFRDAKSVISSFTGTVITLSLMFYINIDVFRSTYVDVMLGIIWGYILLTYFTGKNDIFKCFALSLSLSVITLVKASGVGLAIASMLIFISYETVVNRKDKQNFIRNIKFLAVSFAAFMAAKLSWSAYVSHHNLEEKFEFSSVTVGSLLDLFNGNAPAYRYETISNFTEYLFSGSVFTLHTEISPFIIITTTFVVLILIHLLTAKTDRETSLPCGIAFLIVSIVYTAGLLFSYLFSFSEYEAVTLASFERYMSTLASGAAVIVAYYIFTLLSKYSFKIIVPAVLIICIVINPYAVVNNAKYYNDIDIWARSFREIYDLENNIISRNCSTEDAVLYISPGSQDLTRLQAQYIFTPVSLVAPMNFSPDGSPYSTGDDIPFAMDKEQLRQHLIDNCDYAFIHKAQPEFIEDYKDLFVTDSIVEGLYKVDKTNGTLTVVELL